MPLNGSDAATRKRLQLTSEVFGGNCGKTKMPEIFRFQAYMELLGRFELPTSSLPKANYIIRKDMRHNFRADNQQETIPLCQSTEALV